MASINGITIKKLTTYRGMEGIAYQGDIYLDGKKLGFWSQDGNGAVCDTFEFDKTTLKERIREYYEKNPKVDELKLMGTPIDKVDFDNLPVAKPEDMKVEFFMDDLILLIENEKTFKKAIKSGYSGICLVDTYHTRGPKPRAMVYKWCDKEEMDKVIAEQKAKYPQTYAIYYNSLEDFVK